MTDGTVTPYKVELKPFELFRQSRELVGDRYFLFLGITLLGSFIGGLIPPAILLGPMMCGIYLSYRKLSKKEAVEIGDLFKGFDHFAESLIATLVIVALSLVAAIPFVISFIVGALMADSRDDAAEAIGVITIFGAGLAWFCAVVVLNSLFLFTYALIVDKGMRGIEAVRMSARGTWMNFGGVIKLSLFTMLASILASLLCCGIGGIAILPYLMGVNWLAHKEIFSDREGEASEQTVFVDDDDDPDR